MKKFFKPSFFLKEKELYIISPITHDLYTGIKFNFQTNFLESFEEIPLEKLKNKEVFLVLSTTNFLYEIERFEFPSLIEELILFRIKRHVEELGIFAKPFEIFYRILDVKGNFYTFSFFAIEKEEIESYKAKLQNAKAKLKGITHFIFSISNFFKSFCEVSEEVVLLIKQTKKHLWFLLLRNKNLEYINFIEVDELLGVTAEQIQTSINKAEEYAMRNFQKSLDAIFILQKEFPYELEGVKFQTPKFSFYNKEAEIEFLDYSHYLGIYKLPTEYNFLSKEEIFIEKTMKAVKNLGILLCFLSIIPLSIGGYLHLKTKENYNKLKKELNELASYNEELNQFIKKDEIENIKKFITISKKYTKALLLEKWVLWCAMSLPSGAKIEKMEIQKRSENYNIELIITFPATANNFSMIGYKIINNFSRKIEVNKRVLEFMDEKSQGKLYLKGVWKSYKESI